MGVKHRLAYAFATVVAAFQLFRSDVRLRHLVEVHSIHEEWQWRNSSPPTNATVTNSSWVTTIVIHTSGEMGNHLTHLAHAYPIAWMAERNYGIQTRMILSDQITGGKVNPKSYSAKKIFTKCFPNLQSLYEGARANGSPEYPVRINQMREWELANDTILQHINNGMITSERDVEVTLDHLQFLMQSNQIPEIEANSSISLPFLQSIAMDNFCFVNWFYHELRWLLTFNDTACCKAVPDPDETVLVSCVKTS